MYIYIYIYIIISFFNYFDLFLATGILSFVNEVMKFSIIVKYRMIIFEIRCVVWMISGMLLDPHVLAPATASHSSAKNQMQLTPENDKWLKSHSNSYQVVLQETAIR